MVGGLTPRDRLTVSPAKRTPVIGCVNSKSQPTAFWVNPAVSKNALGEFPSFVTSKRIGVSFPGTSISVATGIVTVTS